MIMHPLLGFDTPPSSSSAHLQGSSHRLPSPVTREARLSLPLPTGGALSLRLAQTTFSGFGHPFHIFNTHIPYNHSLSILKTTRHFQRIHSLLSSKLLSDQAAQHPTNPPPRYSSIFKALSHCSLIINAIASVEGCSTALNARLEQITQLIRKNNTHGDITASLLTLLCQLWQQKILSAPHSDTPGYKPFRLLHPITPQSLERQNSHYLRFPSFVPDSPSLRAQWAAQLWANTLIANSPHNPFTPTRPFPSPPALPRSARPFTPFDKQDLFLLATTVDPSLYCFAQLPLLDATQS